MAGSKQVMQTVRCMAVFKLPGDVDVRKLSKQIVDEARMDHAKVAYSRLGRTERYSIVEVTCTKVGASTYHVRKALQRKFKEHFVDAVLIDVTRDGELV
jgi:hypothetical protein